MAMKMPLGSMREQMADFDKPIPKDLDPEAFGDSFDRALDSDDDNDDSDGDGKIGNGPAGSTPDPREHYQSVGRKRKSKLRSAQGAPELGSLYEGKQIGRSALLGDGDDLDDIYGNDGDEDDEEDDEDPFAKPRYNKFEDDNQDDDDDDDDEEDEEDEENAEPEDGKMELDRDVTDDGAEILGEREDEDSGEGEDFSGFSPRNTLSKLRNGHTGVRSRGPLVNRLESDAAMDSLGLSPNDASEEGKEEEDDSMEDFFNGVDGSDDDSDSDGATSGESSDAAIEDDGDTGDRDEAEEIAAERAAMRDIMASDRKTVIAKISAAVRADADKGAAVRKQRAGFEALLNTRIRLQKALVGINSLDYEVNRKDEGGAKRDHDGRVKEVKDGGGGEGSLDPADLAAVEAAELAALNLLNSLISLGEDLSKTLSSRAATQQAASTSGVKAASYAATSSSTALSVTPSTPASRIYELVNPASSSRDSAPSAPFSSTSRHRATLDKWAAKTRPAGAVTASATISAATAARAAATRNRPLTAVLDRHLDREHLPRLLERTRVARSCAPAQAAAPNVEPAFFDDADWYAALLRDLIDSKMATSASASATAAPPVPSSLVNRQRKPTDGDTTTSGSAMADVALLRSEAKAGEDVARQAKRRAKHDAISALGAGARADHPRGASRGRRLRFTVHEKLQNFAAPRDLGTWGERQAEELFRGLLGGRKDRDRDGDVARTGRGAGNHDDDDYGGEEESDSDAEAKGLKLFGGR